MTFQDVLPQAIDWLQREQRLSYRALKRQFDLDDGYLEDLKEELTEEFQTVFLPRHSGRTPLPAATSRAHLMTRPLHAAAACRSGVQLGAARLSAVWTCGSESLRGSLKRFLGGKWF